MTDKIKIQWKNKASGKGEMIIYSDKFFPCMQKDLRLLINKTIMLDYQHKDEIINQIINHCVESISKLENLEGNNSAEKKIKKYRRNIELLEGI